MLAAHNARRAAAGLRPLTGDGTLAQLARVRAQDMASKGYFSHTSPTGQTAFSLLNSAGYAYRLAGENLARNNYGDGEAVAVAMDGFMNSATHRANILEPSFTNVGIALVVAPDGMKYFVIIFASR